MSKQNTAKTGSIVWVDFQYQDGSGSKQRPALIVAIRGSHYVLAAITSNTSRVDHYKTQMLIDPDECQNSGLKRKSALDCSVLVTRAKSQLQRAIGCLSQKEMARAKNCIRFALGV